MLLTNTDVAKKMAAQYPTDVVDKVDIYPIDPRREESVAIVQTNKRLVFVTSEGIIALDGTREAITQAFYAMARHAIETAGFVDGSLAEGLFAAKTLVDRTERTADTIHNKCDCDLCTLFSIDLKNGDTWEDGTSGVTMKIRYDGQTLTLPLAHSHALLKLLFRVCFNSHRIQESLDNPISAMLIRIVGGLNTDKVFQQL